MYFILLTYFKSREREREKREREKRERERVCAKVDVIEHFLKPFYIF